MYVVLSVQIYVQTRMLTSMLSFRQEAQHAVVCCAATSRLRIDELPCSHIRIVHLAGAKLLQLYHDREAGLLLTAGPSADRLQAIAVQLASQCEWGSAISIGAKLAGQQQQVQAAQIACTVMRGIQGHSLDARLLYQALPWLFVAGKHREATQVPADFCCVVAT